MASYTSTPPAQDELLFNRASNQSEGADTAEIVTATLSPPDVPLRAALCNLHGPDAGTSGHSPTLDSSHIEAHGQPQISEPRAAQRRRCALIAGVGSACALVTGLAMKSAGCTYAEIQWPVTTMVMITGMFLTPAYANSIA